MEVSIGDYVILVKDRTIVDGEISGWMVAGGELVHLFIAGIECPFKMIGEDSWKIEVGKEDDEIQPE